MERSRSSRAVERVSIAGALVTVVAGSLCCVLPFVLVSLGITGSWLGVLQIFEPYRLGLDAASVAALIVGWGVYGYSQRACTAAQPCVSPVRSRRMGIGLAVASIIVGALIAAPYLIAYFGG